MKRIIGLFGALTLLAGCGSGTLTVEGEGSEPPAGAKQEEAWGPADSPALFSLWLDYRLDRLPKKGEAASTPWPGTYWPTYEDSINARWDGEGSDSAALKYQKAFGGTNVEDLVSRQYGVDSVGWARQCSDDSECGSGDTCAKRRGATQGRCIATWWGICHAWAPAAILFPEPRYPVTVNGVTFKVNDLKALASLVHNGVRSKFVSLRCDENGNTVTFDRYGRPSGTSAGCRDTNPGTFHVLVTNYLGRLRQSFAEDRVWDDQVWNQPLRGYEVTEQREILAAEANQLVGATSDVATYQKSGAASGGKMLSLGSFPVSGAQKVTVTLTGSGGDVDLYVKLDQAPGASVYDCRPYDDGADETCELAVPAGVRKVFVSVAGYGTSTQFEVAVAVESPPTRYAFNKWAAKLVYVETTLRYISESSGSTDGYLTPNIDSYTRSDAYQYVLELDWFGNVIGGEWVGRSKRSHPDFLWLPYGEGSPTHAGGAIRYDTVKDLVMKSQSPPLPAVGTPTTFGGSGQLDKGAWVLYGPFSTATDLEFVATMTGERGDADLYVRRGAAPTAAAYDCRPYLSSSREACTIDGGGDIYVGVHGYTGASYAVRLAYSDANHVPPPATVDPTAHLNLWGSVGLREMKVFTLEARSARTVLVKTTSTADVDLYLALDGDPTTTAFAQVANGTTGDEALTIAVPANAKLKIGVYGYQAGTFRLTTAQP